MVLIILLIYPVVLFELIEYSHTGIHRFIHYFFFGSLWAYLYVTSSEWFNSKSFIYDFFIVITFSFGVYLNQVYGWKHIQWYIPILANVWFLACFKGRITNFFLKKPVISTIGSMCYTIYLLHGRTISIPISIFRKFINTGNFTIDLLLLIIVVAPITLFICSIFYLTIERPCMDRNWPHKLKSSLKSIRNR